MTSITLHHGDNRDHLRRLIDQGVRVHSVITDPPYGLTSVVKRFGKDGAAPALSNGPTGVFKRASGGFMGQSWDASGIERDPEFWRLVWEILLPGGFCLAFSSPRTGHWQACAMELAGFTMHPFKGWLYGSGFPKAHNASKAIDKALGAERPVIGSVTRRDIRNGQGEDWGANAMSSAMREGGPKYIEHPITEAATAAAAWNGWAYGAQTLKPALEPIYVGQKPFSEKTGAANLLKHGVGAMNIDACRVASPGETISNHARGAESAVSKGTYGDSSEQETHQTTGQQLGRHPANLLHDGSDAVLALFPDSKGQLARSSSSSDTRKNQSCYGEMARGAPGTEMEPRNDSSSAARFFNSFPLDPEEIPCEIGNEAGTDWGCDSIALYHRKAGKTDRAGSKHPTVKPIGLMRWLVRLVTPPGGTVLDPFAGSGTTAEAARQEGFDCILMEGEDRFAADIRRRFGLPGDASETDTDAAGMKKDTDIIDLFVGTTVENDPFDTVLG